MSKIFAIYGASGFGREILPFARKHMRIRKVPVTQSLRPTACPRDPGISLRSWIAGSSGQAAGRRRTVYKGLQALFG